MNANQITGTIQSFSSELSLCNVAFSRKHFRNGNDVVCYLPLTAKSYIRLQQAPVQKAMPAFTSPDHLRHSNKTAKANSCPDGYLLLPFLFNTCRLSEVLIPSLPGGQAADI